MTEGNNDQSADYNIQEIKRHPNYSLAKKRHDIALIRVSRPIDGSIIPACLQTDNREQHMSGNLIVTGYGSTSAEG